MQDQPTKTEYKPAQAHSPRDYMRIVLARKWIVSFIFLASLGATFYYLKTATPVYQTQVVIMRENAQQLPSSIIGIPLEKEKESLSGHMELLESASSIAEIKKLLKANYNLEFAGKFSLQSDGDSIIRLTARAPTPELVQALANTAAEVYIQKISEMKKSDLDAGVTFLEQQMELGNEKIQQSEEALNEFKNKKGIIVTPQMTSGGLLYKLGEMQGELSKTESDIEFAKAQLQSVQALISEKRQASLSSLTTSLPPQIDMIQSKLIALQLQLDTLHETLTEKDLEVISVQRQIDTLQKRLEAELKEIFSKEGRAGLDPLSELQSLLQQSVLLNVQLMGLEQKATLLTKKIAKFREEHPELIATQVELTRLERQARVYEQTYMTLLDKYEDLRLLKEMKTSGLNIIKEAALPQSPISPQKKKLLIFGLISGLVLGVGFAFFLEYLDDSIKLKEDVERYLALPVMGTIPKIPPFKVPENALSRRALSTASLSTDSGSGLNGLNSDNQGNVTLPMPVPPENPVLIVENPDEDGENATGQPTESNFANLQSKRRQRHAKGHRKRIKQLLSSILLYAEKRTPLLTNYQTLLANIRYANVDTPIQTLLVTSAAQMEGKTATVTNLAISMAQSGGKVLLIDTDLRRPRIHRLFQQDRSPGLTDLLSPRLQSGEDENNSIETVVETLSPPVETQGEHPTGEPFIRQTSIDNLYLLPCGTHVSRPEGLLSSEKMKQLIKSLSSQYDMVFFDTPPLISAADAMILATEVDATLMVIHSGKTKRQVALQGKELLENVDAHIIGAVLNNIDYSKQYGSYYYYYYYYRSYYYSSDDDES